jgi:thiamine kinase-like enzyme
MKIDQLVKFVTVDLLNEMIRGFSGSNAPSITSVKSRPARFPFLENGASNNALFLELSVASDSYNGLPNELVLKAGKNIGGTVEREMRFFKLLANEAPLPQVVRCFGIGWLPEEEIGLLLLENASGEAIVYDEPDESHLSQYKSAIHGLAELHARWWNHPELGTGDLAHLWTDEFLSVAISWARDGFRELVAGSPESWSVTQCEIIEWILSNLQPLLRRRAESNAPMCVNHGDAALWNFVLDKNMMNPAQIVDFQMWCVNPPAWDVGYMIVLLWPTEFRLRFGDEMITTYLDALKAQGISYSKNELLEDLRICIAGLIGLNLANYKLGIWREDQAKDRLDWLLRAFNDYNCGYLLDLKMGA